MGNRDKLPDPEEPRELVADEETLHATSLQVRNRRNLFSFTPNYKCYSCEPPDCRDLTHCVGAHQCWTSHIQDADGTEHLSKGCKNEEDQEQLYCPPSSQSVHVKHHMGGQYAITCCKGDFCNNGSFPELSATVYRNEVDRYPVTAKYIARCILCAVLVLCCFSTVLFIFMRRSRHKYLMDALAFDDLKTHYAPGDLLNVTIGGDSTHEVYIDHSLFTGSGSRLPLLIQDALINQIMLVECITKGSFGEVWRGIWHGEDVVVKLFFSQDKASGRHEMEICGWSYDWYRFKY